MEDVFWSNVKRHIKQRGLTQEQFCDGQDLNFRTFQGWISRKRFPDILNASKIASALETTIEELFGYEKIPDLPEVVKVKQSPSTRKIVNMLIPLSEPQIERVGFGVASAIGSLGLTDIEDHSANAG